MRRWGAGCLMVSMVVGALVSLSGPVAAAPKRPDLVVAKVAVKPGKVAAGGTLRVTETTRNKGRRVAKRSVTRYYLSKNKRLDKADVRLGQRKVRRLKPGGHQAVKNRKLRVPRGTKPGKYRLLACADAKKRVRESHERNNCRVAKRKVTVTAAKGAAAWPRDGAVKVTVRVDADHRRWNQSDTPGTAFERDERISVKLNGTASGMLTFKAGKPQSLVWFWDRATTSGTLTYTAQGEQPGGDCPLWTSQASLSRSGSAVDVSRAAGAVTFPGAAGGTSADLGLSHVLASTKAVRMACGEPAGTAANLELSLKGYWWSRPADFALAWSPAASTVTYHKRQTVNDPSYTEQGWEERTTLRLTPVR